MAPHSPLRAASPVTAVSGQDPQSPHPVTTHSRPVSKSSVKRFCVWEKQVSDVCQALDLKLFWLLFNHLSVKTNTHTVGQRERTRSVRVDLCHPPGPEDTGLQRLTVCGQPRSPRKHQAGREPLLSSLPQRKGLGHVTLPKISTSHAGSKELPLEQEGG